MVIATALIICAVLLAFIAGILIWKMFSPKEKFQYREAKEVLEAHKALENLREQIGNKMQHLNNKTMETLSRDIHPDAIKFYLGR